MFRHVITTSQAITENKGVLRFSELVGRCALDELAVRRELARLEPVGEVIPSQTGWPDAFG